MGIDEQGAAEPAQQETMAPVEIVRAKETVHRPPPPPAGLYDVCTRKTPVMIRRPPAAEDDTPVAAPRSNEDPRLVRANILPVSSSSARSALEAWSAAAPRRKAPRGPA